MYIYIYVLLLICIVLFLIMLYAFVVLVDEMGNRIDDLESSIAELMQQAGIDVEEEKEDGSNAGK